MSDHDAGCVDSEQTPDKECSGTAEGSNDVTETGESSSAVPNESANNDGDVNTETKESLSSGVDEKKDLYGVNRKGSILWTEEGSQLRVSWNLLEGTATQRDYVALCYTG